MSLIRKLKLAAAATLLAAACSPAAEKAEEKTGLPMWVIKDADSTIYLTGTVHLLPPDVDWRSPRVEKAIEEATEVWLEVPMPTSQEEMLRQYGRMMMSYMFSFNRPLSSLLTEEENAQLAEAVKRAKLPEGAADGLNMMKPWAVTMMLGMGPLVASGFDPESGIDINIARIAEEQGDKILGFETFEQQMKMLAGGAEEEQLEALRKMISAPPRADEEAVRKKAEDAYTGWARGEIKPVEELVAEMRAQDGDPSLGSVSVEVILDNRNEDWARQLEDRLKGSGVSFVAVGAAHLVGPASVQERLKLRGIEAKPY
jgi:uncharacterized protein YbaP (TraB family)